MISPDLLREIFSVPVPKSPPALLQSKITDLAKNIRIPKFNTGDVKSLVNRVKGGEPLGAVLNSLHYSFAFSEGLLTDILNIDAQERDILNYLSLLGIYSFVTWFSQPETRQNGANTKLLVRALLHVRGKGAIIDNLLNVLFGYGSLG